MSAAARIRIVRGGAERAIDVGGGAVSIGRAAGQLLRIVEDDVAPEHAVLHLDATWEIEARAPLTLDDQPLAAGTRAPLSRGARLGLGSWTLLVGDPPAGAEAAGPARTASLARELVRDLLGGDDASAAPSLRVTAGPAVGQTLVVPASGRLVIGRGEDADALVLDPDLSRAHVAFERTADGVRVLDLGSKNGTRVAGALAPTAPPGRLLRDGDEVAAGATVLAFSDPTEAYLRELGPAPEPPSPPPPPAPSAPPRRRRFDVLTIAVAGTIALAALAGLLWLLG